MDHTRVRLFDEKPLPTMTPISQSWCTQAEDIRVPVVSLTRAQTSIVTSFGFFATFFFCLKRERRRSVTCVQVLPTITPTSAVGFFHAHDMRQPVVSLRTANTSRSTSWGWEEISPFTSHDNPFKKEKSRNLRSWLLAAGDIFSSQQFERNYQNQCKKP